MSDNQETKVGKAKKLLERAATSAQFSNWASEAETCESFYEGNQLTPDELQELEDNGQPAYVVNKIRTRINNICGQDVQTRTAIRYRSRSASLVPAEQDEQKKTAEALTSLGLYIQDSNDANIEFSDVFRNSAITGLGWMELCIEEDDGIKVRSIPYNEIIWDIGDRSRDMSNQRYVFRQHTMTREEAEAMWPGKTADIREAPAREDEPRMYEQSTAMHDRAEPYQTVWYYDRDLDMVQVWEYQYKTKKTQYEVTCSDGRIVRTFDKKEAQELGNKDTITERLADQVSVMYFCNDVMLDEFELDPQTGHFTYIPFVMNRQKRNGQPYGLVRPALDSQRSYNKRNSKLLWLLNARQVIADADAVDDMKQLAIEAARPDGVILKKPGKEVTFVDHKQDVQAHQGVLDRINSDIQDAMGIYDESLGMETNATSGKAIQSRQVGTVRNNTTSFDQLRVFKRKIGRVLLDLIQHFFTQETALYITDDEEEVQALRLNIPLVDENGKEIKKDGKPVFLNDIRTGKYDVYIDEMPDFATPLDAVQERLQMLLMNGVVPTPGLLELLGVQKSAKIYKELSQGVVPQIPQDSASPAPQGASGQPAPTAI